MGDVHFTFCLFATVVTDLERSTRFYCDALGFTECNTAGSGGPEMQRLLDIAEETNIIARYLTKDGAVLELVHFQSPEVAPAVGYRPITQAGGPSHLALNVTDLDAGIALIRAHGGQVLEDTRARFDMGDDPPIEMILCLDPDGLRIELLCMDEAVRRQWVGLPA